MNDVSPIVWFGKDLVMALHRGPRSAIRRPERLIVGRLTSLKGREHGQVPFSGWVLLSGPSEAWWD